MLYMVDANLYQLKNIISIVACQQITNIHLLKTLQPQPVSIAVSTRKTAEHQFTSSFCLVILACILARRPQIKTQSMYHLDTSHAEHFFNMLISYIENNTTEDHTPLYQPLWTLYNSKGRFGKVIVMLITETSNTQQVAWFAYSILINIVVLGYQLLIIGQPTNYDKTIWR